MKLKFPLYLNAESDAGGSAAAVLDAPSEHLDVSTFEPTSPSDIEAMMQEDAPAAKPPEKPKAEAPKPDPKKADDPKKPEGEKPKGEPPAAQLRREFDATKKERDEAKARVAELEKSLKENPELTSTRAELEAARKEREALQKEVEGYTRKMAMVDPRATKPIRDLDEKFDREMLPQLSLIPGLTGKEGTAKYGALVRAFEQLPHGTPEYNDALREFRESLRGEFEDDASTVLNLVRRGMAHTQEARELMSKLQTDAHKMAFESTRQEWDSSVKAFEEKSANWLDPEPDAADKDPFNPLLYFKSIRETRGEEFDRELKMFKDFIRRTSIGPKPDSDEDYVGMQPEEVQKARQENQVKHREALESRDKLLLRGLVALRNHRPLIAEVARLREELDKIRGGTPPDPTETPGIQGTGGDDGDISKWEPPAVDEAAFN